MGNIKVLGWQTVVTALIRRSLRSKGFSARWQTALLFIGPIIKDLTHDIYGRADGGARRRIN